MHRGDSGSTTTIGRKRRSACLHINSCIIANRKLTPDAGLWSVNAVTVEVDFGLGLAAALFQKRHFAGVALPIHGELDYLGS